MFLPPSKRRDKQNQCRDRPRSFSGVVIVTETSESPPCFRHERKRLDVYRWSSGEGSPRWYLPPPHRPVVCRSGDATRRELRRRGGGITRRPRMLISSNKAAAERLLMCTWSINSWIYTVDTQDCGTSHLFVNKLFSLVLTSPLELILRRHQDEYTTAQSFMEVRFLSMSFDVLSPSRHV